VSEAIVITDPHTYTTAFAKSGREHKILIDYLRNNRTNTSVCAFSPRARAGCGFRKTGGQNLRNPQPEPDPAARSP
jgi:DNA primase